MGVPAHKTHESRISDHLPSWNTDLLPGNNLRSTSAWTKNPKLFMGASENDLLQFYNYPQGNCFIGSPMKKNQRKTHLQSGSSTKFPKLQPPLVIKYACFCTMKTCLKTHSDENWVFNMFSLHFPDDRGHNAIFQNCTFWSISFEFFHNLAGGATYTQVWLVCNYWKNK